MNARIPADKLPDNVMIVTTYSSRYHADVNIRCYFES